MTDYLTEQEQIQQLKAWIKQYGLTILLGIVIALIITSVWHYWQNYHDQTLQRASVLYDDLLIQRAQGNREGTDSKAKKILKDYSNTPYADLSTLMLARNDVLNQKYDSAIKHLKWVLKNSKVAAIREIARVRIARILMTEKKPNDALGLLKTIDDKNFIGLIDEIRGDAFLLKNDVSSAKAAYQKALHELPPNAQTTRPILGMKLENLAT